jgi:hypothetical protein
MLVTMVLVATSVIPAAFSRPTVIAMPTDVDDNHSPVSFAHALRPDYYAKTCPDVRDLVRTAVVEALENDIAIAAGLLRIFFHDCFPQVQTPSGPGNHSLTFYFVQARRCYARYFYPSQVRVLLSSLMRKKHVYNRAATRPFFLTELEHLMGSNRCHPTGACSPGHWS